MPITWKNVEGRGAGDAALLMAGAAKSVQAAGKSFTSALDANKTRVEAISATEREANTDRFKDALAASTTVGQLEGNQANINALKQQFDGGNIDQDLLRDGYNDRLTELRTEETAANDYQMGIDKKAANPLAQKFKALVLADKDEEANQLLTDNAELFDNVGMTADLNLFRDNRDQTEITRASDAEQRLRDKADQASNDAFDGVLAKVPDFDSVYQLQNYLSENAKDLGINERTLATRQKEIPGAWQDYFQLSDADQAEVDGYSANADAEAAALEESAIHSYGLIEEQYPVALPEAWGREATNSKHAKELIVQSPEEGGKGYDLNPGGSDVDVQLLIDSELDKFFGDGKGFPKDIQNIRGQLAYRAAEMLPQEDHFFGKGDLTRDVYQEALRAAYSEYNVVLQNKKARSEALKARDADLERAQDIRSSSTQFLKNVQAIANLRKQGWSARSARAEVMLPEVQVSTKRKDVAPRNLTTIKAP